MFCEIQNDDLYLIDGGVDWGSVAGGALCIVAAVGCFGLCVAAAPIVPLAVCTFALGVNCGLVGLNLIASGLYA